MNAVLSPISPAHDKHMSIFLFIRADINYSVLYTANTLTHTHARTHTRTQMNLSVCPVVDE